MNNNELFHVVDLGEATKISFRPHPYNVWISLVDPETPRMDDLRENIILNAPDKVCRHYLAYFYDVRTKEEQAMTSQPGPDEEIIASLKTFLLGVADMHHSSHRKPRVLIHCYAGISRSTATALMLAMLCKASPEEALGKLLIDRPCAWPSQLMLELFDATFYAPLLEGCALAPFIEKWKKSQRGIWTGDIEDCQ